MPCAAIHRLRKGTGVDVLEAIHGNVFGGDGVQDPSWVVPGDLVDPGREQALAKIAWRRRHHGYVDLVWQGGMNCIRDIEVCSVRSDAMM